MCERALQRCRAHPCTRINGLPTMTIASDSSSRGEEPHRAVCSAGGTDGHGLSSSRWKIMNGGSLEPVRIPVRVFDGRSIGPGKLVPKGAFKRSHVIMTTRHRSGRCPWRDNIGTGIFEAMDVASLIRGAREHAHLTQAELAARAGTYQPRPHPSGGPPSPCDQRSDLWVSRPRRGRPGFRPRLARGPGRAPPRTLPAHGTERGARANPW